MTRSAPSCATSFPQTSATRSGTTCSSGARTTCAGSRSCTRAAGPASTGRPNTAAPAGRRCRSTSSPSECAFAHTPRIVPVRPRDGRPGHLHLRQRGAESALPAGHPRQQCLVVPGLLRAERGLRPRLAAHQRGARRRPLRGERHQDLDHHGPVGRLDLLPGAHRRPGTQAASRHQLPADRHEDARHHGLADPPARRHARGERGALRQRARSRREPGRRGEPRLDLRQVPAHARAHRHRPGRQVAHAPG